MRLIYGFIALLFLINTSTAQTGAGADYQLTIDGVEQNLTLGKEAIIELKSGIKVPAILKKREFGNFITNYLSFDFPGQYTVASSPVDDTITQHIVVTALGTMMLVQDYEDNLPSGMLEIMYDVMVKEPKALGLDIEKSELTRKIANQDVLTGLQARYKDGDEDVIIDIIATPSGQGGFLIVTMHDKLMLPDESGIIERFWESVTLKK